MLLETWLAGASFVNSCFVLLRVTAQKRNQFTLFTPVLIEHLPSLHETDQITQLTGLMSNEFKNGQWHQQLAARPTYFVSLDFVCYITVQSAQK